jgi:fructose-specific phosphotransferase system IIC component
MCAGHMLNQGPVAKGGTTPAMASGNISGPVPAAVVPQEIKKANWFERHLNWSLVLCGFLGGYVAALVAGFLVGIVAAVINPTITDEPLGTLASVFVICAMLATLIGVTVWYLKRKGRHMGHLAWLICPFGYIVLLCLENRGS